MNILFIEQLLVMAFIGIYDWEEKRLQKLILDLRIGYTNKLLRNNMNNVSTYLNCIYLDYSQICRMVLDAISEKRFYLIEHVADIVANLLLKNFCISWVKVKVSKPDAIGQVHNVGISVFRKR